MSTQTYTLVESLSKRYSKWPVGILETLISSRNVNIWLVVHLDEEEYVVEGWGWSRESEKERKWVIYTICWWQCLSPNIRLFGLGGELISMPFWIDEWMNEWMNECHYKAAYGSLVVQCWIRCIPPRGAILFGFFDNTTNQWMDGWMDGLPTCSSRYSSLPKETKQSVANNLWPRSHDSQARSTTTPPVTMT